MSKRGNNFGRGRRGFRGGRGWRGRGRGRGLGPRPQYIPLDDDFDNPPQPCDIDEEEALGSRKGRGGRSKLSSAAPLSELLLAERPLLRPVIFVPSIYTRRLFEQEEDILKPVGDDQNNSTHDDTLDSHVPTAERVAQVFSGAAFARTTEPTNEIDEDIQEIEFADIGQIQEQVDAAHLNVSEKMEEIEFTEIGRLQEVVDAEQVVAEFQDVITVGGESNEVSIDAQTEETDVHLSTAESRFSTNNTAIVNDELTLYSPTPVEVHVSEEVETSINVPEENGFVAVDSTSTGSVFSNHARTSTSSCSTEALLVASDALSPPLFFVDTAPSCVAEVPSGYVPSGGLADITRPDEEVIVYDAPFPRPGSVSQRASPALLPESSAVLPYNPVVGTSAPLDVSAMTFSFMPSPTKQPQHPVIHTPHDRTRAKLLDRRRRSARKRNAGLRAKFSSFGAAFAEAQLQGEDPNFVLRRRGDSDLDWGDEDKSSPSPDAEGMDVDPDIEAGAMKRFAASMDAQNSNHMTMDDIADLSMMKIEDEDDAKVSDEDSDKDDDFNLAFEADENIMVGDSEIDGSTEEDDDFEMDETASSSFQRRLARIRQAAHEKRNTPLDWQNFSDLKNSDDDSELNASWAERDDDFITHIQDLIDENNDFLRGNNRKKRSKVFRSVLNGSFEDLSASRPAKRTRDKGQDLPPELQAQFEKDRQKKAEVKRQRQLARLEAAADPLAYHKGGKKGRKAMLAAARLDPTVTALPNRIIDMVTLVQQIRRFLEAIGGPKTMSLPPTSKEVREQIHKMALAFNLKSKSSGKGNARYTSLIKTTKSGVNINEKKIGEIVRRFDPSYIPPAKNGQSTRTPRQKEGEEVGKSAPKIGESNVGFKMLTSMGWSEGDRIGVSGGLDVPIAAIIKTSKLGLGATR
ncbi:hypothetical protein FISHEDRAFT_71324 [Fistulina hepatica ATCC 64428]|nr:hypothetical protein FISHEDRAFT_71324 [Fistulina hepatica ATCC 64428]